MLFIKNIYLKIKEYLNYFFKFYYILLPYNKYNNIYKIKITPLLNNIVSDSFLYEIILFDYFINKNVQKLNIHTFDFILNIYKSNNYNNIFLFFL